MILVDANVFMYAAGKPHPFKAPSAALLERVASGRVDAAVDAETLQEILHRYRALRRWQDGREVYGLVRRIMVTVLPITAEVLDEAKSLLDAHATLMARDALHGAVCRHFKARAICSYDTDFEQIPGLRRLRPEDA